MDDILDEIEKEVELSDSEIFLEIWTEPRKVFKFLHEKSYDKYVLILVILASTISALDRASSKNLGDSFELWQILLISIIAGVLFGWILHYIYSALISFSGKLINGTQNAKAVLRVIS